jgi:hypothetical protein
VPLDGANTQVLCSLLAPFLSVGGPCRLTVVLGNVAHVSGLALHVFARLHEQLRAGGGRLTLSDLPDGGYEDVEVVRLTAALGVRRRWRGGRPRPAVLVASAGAGASAALARSPPG